MIDKNLHIPSFMTNPDNSPMAAAKTQVPTALGARKPASPSIGPASKLAATSSARFAPVSAAPSQRLPTADQPLSQIRVLTLAQMTQGAPWLLEQLHVRNHHLVLWTTRGQGRVLLHGVRRGFGAHNALFIPAGKLLAFELSLQVQGLATLIPDDGRVQLPDRTQHLRLQDGLEQAELTSIFDALRRELHQDRPLMVEALNAHAQLLSVTLRRDMQMAGAPPPARAGERLVRRFCDILSTHFSSGHPMAWYADQLDITPTHLTRVCRQSAGLTAADMLTQMVQHRARQMLIDTDMPMNRIADSLGFGSAAYFTRFCQHHFGHTPSQIRKSSQETRTSL